MSLRIPSQEATKCLKLVYILKEEALEMTFLKDFLKSV